MTDQPTDHAAGVTGRAEYAKMLGKRLGVENMYPYLKLLAIYSSYSILG